MVSSVLVIRELVRIYMYRLQRLVSCLFCQGTCMQCYRPCAKAKKKKHVSLVKLFLQN